MSNQNKSFDKVNMSLDEIIKLNRNQSRQSKFAANRNLNGNNKTNNRQNGNKNNFQKQNQTRRQQPAHVNNKPYGMLNKSKKIQKRNNNAKQNVFIINAQRGNQPQQQIARRFPRNLTNRRRRVADQAPQRVFNRFGTGNSNTGSKFQFQNGQNNAPKNNNQQKRQKQFTTRPMPARPNRAQILQKRRQQLSQPRAANNVRTKIAMQSARKNIMKAKRVLANKTVKKGPVQQIMTQRYAKSLGLIQQGGAKIKRNNNNFKKTVVRNNVQKQSKMLTVSINNKINKANRVKQQQKQKLQKTAQLVKQQFKKPILNRNRQQGQQSSVGRKVFF